jgi:stress-induced morphogen
VMQIRRLNVATALPRRRPMADPRRRHDTFALLHPGLMCTRIAPSSHALFARLSTPRFYSTPSETPSVGTGRSQSDRPEPPDHLDEKERAIFDRLNDALQPIALQVRLTLHNYTQHGVDWSRIRLYLTCALVIQVEDISGGCGSMYAVAITAEKFKGLPVIKQHRLVNEVLGEDIKSWHGIQLRTKAP